VGWQDREYNRDQRDAGRFGLLLPPKTAFTLVAIHTTAFLLLGLARFRDLEPIRALLPLTGPESPWLAVFLHPIAAQSFAPFLVTVFTIWTLGARIESRWGGVRMLGYYLTGNVIAGAVYFGVANMAPGMAGVPLVMPAGGLIAWVLAAWREIDDEMVSIFGNLTSLGKAAGIGALIVLGFVAVRYSLGGFGWVLAAAAGGAAQPLIAALAASSPRPAGGWRDPGPAALRARPARRPRPIPDDALPPIDVTGDEDDIDDILTKISERGIESLTPDDRARLESARQARLRSGR